MSKTPTVVSVINLKGGVGKTTVTALLARYAAYCGWNVLAVDMDPQANLSQALMTETEYQKFMDEKRPSIVELFNGFMPASADKPSPRQVQPAEVVTEAKFGYFLYSSKRSDGGKLEIIPSRFDFSDNLIKSIGMDEKVLANFIAQHMQHKDLILIDCAPTESKLTRASYHASRYVLIPVKTEFFSTIGFPLMKKSLDDFRANNHGHAIDVLGVLVHRIQTSGSRSSVDARNSLEDIEGNAYKYGWQVFEKVMHHSNAYPKWTQSPFANHLRNAQKEWPAIAKEILAAIGLER